MSADFHKLAKEKFAELVDLNIDGQKSALRALSAEDPELASEVGSLLDYHTAQSLIAPATAPKIRTRSTLSTQYDNRSLEWLTTPARGLLLTIPFLVAAACLVAWSSSRINEDLDGLVKHQLENELELKYQSFTSWEENELQRATNWASQAAVASIVEELVEESESLVGDALVEHLSESNAGTRLQSALTELAGRPVKFAVWDRRMYTLADWNQEKNPEVLGAFVTSTGANTLARVLKDRPAMYLPYLSSPISLGYRSDDTSPVLSIFVPVYGDSPKRPIAIMMLRGYGLEESYEDMLLGWNTEENREFYLISRDCAMISPSRYPTENLDIAFKKPEKKLLPWVRDPGVNLINGEKPSTQPLGWLETLLARQVKSRDRGVIVEGYRNYVGEKVVGAWQWMPQHEAMLAYEIDFEYSFGAAKAFRYATIGMSTLFGLSLLAFFSYAAFTRAARRRLRDLSEVGPYQIQEIVGEGGMGRVYLAEHALLCRQSAVKVLIKGENDLSIISRFEREVQLASQLTHPNTIAIYDFGRNKDGIFYYAMEYINGAHLGQLIEYEGALPPGRCIYILRQLCRALQEAHQAGVVHRDIKPQNIMVCNRGGEPDFVKLFDYGLVKAFAPGVSHSTSQTEVVVGTPRFMAPERLNSPWLADPRVDVYSIGALAYFLLTGQLPPLVSPTEGMDSEQAGVETIDLPADVVEFGGLLSICMSVEPSTRPSSMMSLLNELEELSEKFQWSREDSLQWWETHEPKLLQYVASKRKSLSKAKS